MITNILCCICNIYYVECMKNEDTNGVTANQRTYNIKKNRDKGTHNELQNNTYKTKDLR